MSTWRRSNHGFAPMTVLPVLVLVQMLLELHPPTSLRAQAASRPGSDLPIPMATADEEQAEYIPWIMLPQLTVSFDWLASTRVGWQPHALPWTVAFAVAEAEIQKELGLDRKTIEQLTRELHRPESGLYQLPRLLQIMKREQFRLPPIPVSKRALEQALKAWQEAHATMLEPLTESQRQRLREIHRYTVLRMYGPADFCRIFSEDLEPLPASLPVEELEPQLTEVWRKIEQENRIFWEAALDRMADRLCQLDPSLDRQSILDPEWRHPLWADLIQPMLAEDETSAARLEEIRDIHGFSGMAGYKAVLSTNWFYRTGANGNLVLEFTRDDNTFAMHSRETLGKYLLFVERNEVNELELTPEQRVQLRRKMDEYSELVNPLVAGGKTNRELVEAELAWIEEIWAEVLLPVQREHLANAELTLFRKKLGPLGLALQLPAESQEQAFGILREEFGLLNDRLLETELRGLDRQIALLPPEIAARVRTLIGKRPAYLRPCLSIPLVHVQEAQKKAADQGHQTPATPGG